MACLVHMRPTIPATSLGNEGPGLHCQGFADYVQLVFFGFAESPVLPSFLLSLLLFPPAFAILLPAFLPPLLCSSTCGLSWSFKAQRLVGLQTR